MTERLYFTDSHLLEFDAKVVAVEQVEGRTAVVLDRTAFYPTGGGQPFDTGEIALADGKTRWRVEDVAADEASGRVTHLLAAGSAVGSGGAGGTAGLAAGVAVQGRIDAARRRDHLQQHTGQHILSQAFVKVANLETQSFHLGAETSTIDVDAGVTAEIVAKAVAVANEIVFSDRPAKVHDVTPAELARFPIRKQTFHGERIRLIEIEDFDVSTCGGTHAHRTGEVGLIVVKGFEKSKGLVRVEFVCGGRALREYQADHRIVQEIGKVLSTAAEQLVAQVTKLSEQGVALRKRTKQLFELAADQQARELLAEASAHGAAKLVVKALPELSFDEMQILSRKLTAGPGVIVLLGVPEAAGGAGAKLLFGRSAELGVAMGPLVKQVAERFGGKGGGGPGSGQGAIARAGDLGEALAEARELLPPA